MNFRDRYLLARDPLVGTHPQLHSLFFKYRSNAVVIGTQSGTVSSNTYFHTASATVSDVIESMYIPLTRKTATVSVIKEIAVRNNVRKTNARHQVNIKLPDLILRDMPTCMSV